MEIKELMKADAAAVERALSGYVGETDPEFGVIFDAMRYSLMAGGKRLRPFLTLEFARLAAAENGSDADKAFARAMPYACAVEMIHTYSLIHDDLPCMDNDDLRRGKPTSHKVFGYANALLAGDALLTKAFETAAGNELASPGQNCRSVRLMAECAGASGMVGGQVLDLEGENTRFGFETLERLQSLKTGELIRCASLLGCIAGGASERLEKAAEEYSMGLGRAFQIEDDILDVTGSTETLGKPVGSDAESHKTTFLSFMTIPKAREYAAELTTRAVGAISDFPGSEALAALAGSLLSRNN